MTFGILGLQSQLTNAQTHYIGIELDLLAIIETVQEYCTILLGHLVKIYTDDNNKNIFKGVTLHLSARIIAWSPAPAEIE
jgi:hypothetical protein